MSLPPGAIFELELDPGVVLYDVSHMLPRHPTKRYESRPAIEVIESYVHHSGRLGASGFAGLYNATRYTIRHHGWPGFPYHYWLPFHPIYDLAGSFVVFRGQPDTVSTYHAGKGPNARGVAHCLQGNTTLRAPTGSQLQCLGALLRWHMLPVLGHCEAGPDGHAKASCPGSHAMAFLQGRRSNS